MRYIIVFVLIWLSCVGLAGCSQPPATRSPSTVEEIAYTMWFDDINSKLDRSLDEFNEALENYAKNRTDITAQLEVAREIVNFTIIYDEAVAKKAPTSLSQVHQALVNGLEKYNTISDIIEGKSNEKLATMLEDGSRLVLEANNLYRSWRGTHLLP